MVHIKEVIKKVPVKEKIYVDVIKEVEKEVIKYVQVIKKVPVEKIVEVPVEKIVYIEVEKPAAALNQNKIKVDLSGVQN